MFKEDFALSGFVLLKLDFGFRKAFWNNFSKIFFSKLENNLVVGVKDNI